MATTKYLPPGTVIISAAGETGNVRKTLSPVLRSKKSTLYYIDFSADNMKLGGSALAQTLNKLGSEAPTVTSPEYFAATFNTVQQLVDKKKYWQPTTFQPADL